MHLRSRGPSVLYWANTQWSVNTSSTMYTGESTKCNCAKHQDSKTVSSLTTQFYQVYPLEHNKHIIERQAKSQQIAEQSLLSCLQCLLPTKSSA